MKKITLFSIVAEAALFVFNACNKDITETRADLQALAPANQDHNAGAWATNVLATPDQIAIPTPLPTSSPEYQAELALTKQAVANLNDEQRDIIRYWSAGSVLRWNEIMRYLVAKHNLAPAPNDDGTYPAPSAMNPFAYPEFPFANPPYAARAYAYVSVAQYDALVAAWHYKFDAAYTRPSPYNADSSIEPFHVAKNDLPSYPCEDAVIAGAAFTLLRAMFPADTTFINEKVAEAAWYKHLAGAAVPSGVDAGLALGKAVGAKVMDKARTDKMGASNGTPGIRDSLRLRVEALGEISWVSLEDPARPGMLCMFGGVTP